MEVNFLQFLVIKTLAPDLHLEKMMDPDPHSNPIYSTETILNLKINHQTSRKIKVDLLVKQPAGLEDFRAWPVSDPRYNSQKTAQGETNCTKIK
jgi:hypothetical protein